MLTKTEERIYDVLNEYKYEPVKRDTIWRKLFGGLVAILLIGLGIYFLNSNPCFSAITCCSIISSCLCIEACLGQ